jgi:hypothetical protein
VAAANAARLLIEGDQLAWESPERHVQLMDEFADPPTATRCVRMAPQNVHHNGMRKAPRLRDMGLTRRSRARSRHTYRPSRKNRDDDDGQAGALVPAG